MNKEGHIGIVQNT